MQQVHLQFITLIVRTGETKPKAPPLDSLRAAIACSIFEMQQICTSVSGRGDRYRTLSRPDERGHASLNGMKLIERCLRFRAATIRGDTTVKELVRESVADLDGRQVAACECGCPWERRWATDSASI
jgi:hypothetical protein